MISGENLAAEFSAAKLDCRIFGYQKLTAEYSAVKSEPVMSWSMPLFLAKDVAEWIEHSDVSTMLRIVEDTEKLIGTIFLSGQNREVTMLTEDGVYEVLMQSRMSSG